MADNPELQHLRVLIANQRSDRLDHVTNVVVGLGHEVVARSIEVDEVAAVTRREQPDVALVGLGDSSAHARFTSERRSAGTLPRFPRALAFMTCSTSASQSEWPVGA